MSSEPWHAAYLTMVRTPVMPNVEAKTSVAAFPLAAEPHSQSGFIKVYLENLAISEFLEPSLFAYLLFM